MQLSSSEFSPEKVQQSHYNMWSFYGSGFSVECPKYRLDRIFQLPGHFEGWACVYALSSSNHKDKDGQLKTLESDKFHDITSTCKDIFSVAKKWRNKLKELSNSKMVHNLNA